MHNLRPFSAPAYGNKQQSAAVIIYHKVYWAIVLICCLYPNLGLSHQAKKEPQQHPTATYQPTADNRKTLVVSHFPGSYFPQILDLALSKTRSSHGPYQLVPAKGLHVKQRARQMLKQGKQIRVLWSTTSAKREAELRPIKFSLFKGLNQYRILLIRKGDQERFDGIQTLADLRQHTGGSGTYWQDTTIFKTNAVPVVTTTEMKGLLKMLAAKRFDYISRGAYEIWGELEKPAFDSFEMESHLLLKYTADYHFFVHPDDDELAERLEQGLNIAAADGSFDTLFFQSHSHKKAWQEVHHSKRLLIELD